ncbi:winged helix-turn-helix domain-containing tetratricopeptide repeat protein [Phenylobacterium sp.]|jgi:TolB-like protein|uniref:winged helix-turn-helix domain-containing tetratricopeptide repeat protein n=1 Tax=Phenylobacterium sp. TaxID=1871053 RepID=UPI002E2F7DE1|nr:winged helix-turn-helix domain-containing protein [Phenylobacterium sp.]HEX2561440.1 winged helix-turn-helix domain-containing protein [Phenylobacterium sp.]
MIYRFGAFRLDAAACELRNAEAHVPMEPQVFALLRLLIENRHRLVGKDEIVDTVWNGRIVSEAAISSRVKSLRQALGDDGAAQRIVRTVPKMGFRFVAEVETDAGPEPAVGEAPATEASEPSSRPSIAVLPFSVLGGGPSAAALADALPHDLIAELSRLRWLFVIARGSTFRFRGAQGDLAAIRTALGAAYGLTGSVEVGERLMLLTVELSDTRDGGVIWSERFRAPPDAVHEIREQIVRAVIAALELQVPLIEARRARLTSPENLDAWAAYHLGLGHMYRFTADGAARAAELFRRAVELEPTFARAHAGLSFTHFETAFLSFTDAPGEAAALAQRAAETSLEHDPLDPFCNLVMGRVFWLRRDLEAGLPWLERAIALNPNYPQAKYSKAWTETLMGQGLEGRSGADEALRLSPLDPLAYGMLGVRALSHLVLDEPDQAAAWGERAARAPGAHALIHMIAAVGHSLAGDPASACRWAASARARKPGLSAEDFLAAFPFHDAAARRRVVRGFEALR